jgi:hypothetical protein
MIPSRQPTSQPTVKPSIQPTSQPSRQPTNLPSQQPTLIPSIQPSLQPSSMPSRQPTHQPSLKPSRQPTNMPSSQPSFQPSRQPSSIPTRQPSSQPTKQPLALPTTEPSRQPSIQPSKQPTLLPSTQPSKKPTTLPTNQPSSQPSSHPTRQPSFQPTAKPSAQPSIQPSDRPTSDPSSQPSRQPTSLPTCQPTSQPTVQPTIQPTTLPSEQPSTQPTMQPTSRPSTQPTGLPTMQPTMQPTLQPSNKPTMQPSKQPTRIPTSQPSKQPSQQPTRQPSCKPSLQPSRQPTIIPSSQPSRHPSHQPTSQPTIIPSRQPSRQPSNQPTILPSCQPTSYPSSQPSSTPSTSPTHQPTSNPTQQPTGEPSRQPICRPSTQPSRKPSGHPSSQPTKQPSCHPSTQPSVQPTNQPSLQPSSLPSSQPTKQPVSKPSRQPSSHPTRQPSTEPTTSPSSQPSCQPTSRPSKQPTIDPTCVPSGQPSKQPSSQPSKDPTAIPSRQPSSHPSRQPSSQPSKKPSKQPTSAPSSFPSSQPTSNPTNPTNQPTSQPSSEPSSSTPTSKPSSHPSQTAPPLRPDQSHKPTGSPTSTPSYNTNDYEQNMAYGKYNDAKLTFQTIPDSVSYSNFYYKGLYVDGSCNNWRSTIYDSLLLPFDELYFTEIAAYFVMDKLNSQQNNNIIDSMITCSDAQLIVTLLSYFDNNGIGGQVNCHGNTWRVFFCYSDPILCVNCKRSCAETVSCPGTSYKNIINNIINPCNIKCKKRAAAGASIVFKYSILKLYPQFITSLSIIETNKTTISISLQATVPGNIYCAAFTFGCELTTVVSIRNTGVSGFITIPESSLTLTLQHLSPDTKYDVYCYSEDFIGHIMPLTESILHKQSVTTACCKEILFLSTFYDIPQYFQSYSIDDEPKFILGLNAKPTRSINIALSVVPITSTTTANDITVLPSLIIFNQNSPILTSNFIIRGTFAGSYLLSTNSDSSYYGFNVTISIQNIRAKPEAPTILSAKFSNDGTQIIVTFDKLTNSANPLFTSTSSSSSSFKCNMLLTFPGVINTFCQWNSPKQLVIILSNSYILPNVGDIIILSGNVITAICTTKITIPCSSYKATPLTNIIIEAPIDPILPSLQLLAASSVNYCDDIYLYPEGSTGFAGRIWKSVRWNVYNNKNGTEVRKISDYLNRAYPDTSYVIKVPEYLLLIKNIHYRFELIVENFLLKAAMTSVIVYVRNSESSLQPQVLNLGPNKISYRWKSISLYAIASIPSCIINNDDIDNISITYDWKVYKGFKFIPNIKSVSLDSRYFKLKPYTLDASSMYTFLITAYVTSSSNKYEQFFPSSTKYSIQIGTSGISAIISGPSEITSSHSYPIILDASQSFDIDYPVAEDPAANNVQQQQQQQISSFLNYTWGCSFISSSSSSLSYGTSCDSYIINRSKSILIFPSNYFESGKFKFSVIVSNYIGSFSIASVIVTVIENSLPSIDIINSFKSIYNVNDKIIITGIISSGSDSSKSNILASWSSSNIQDLSLLSTFSTLTKIFPLGVSKYQLSLKPYSLTAGLSYQFLLTTKYLNTSTMNSISSSSDSSMNSDSSRSIITIVINSPPIGGFLSCYPSIGLSMITTFQVSTYLWSDDDMPLSYILSYYILDPNQQLIIKSYDAISWSNTILGQGLLINKYSVTIIAMAIDTFNGQGNITQSVVVQPANSTIIIQTSKRNLNIAIHEKDYGRVNQIVSATVNDLNSVDCSASPSCRTINRQECQYTANTCGTCLYGYIGVGGDSNLPCQLQGQLVGIGDRCTADSSCYTGVCDHDTCGEVSKSCPNDCSEKGTCIFLNSDYIIQQDCSVSNRLCSAQCSCFSGFYGADCSLTESLLLMKLTMRELLCNSLMVNLRYQDMSDDVVVTRAVQIANLFQDMTQISDIAFMECSNVLVQTVEKNPVCQGSSAITIMNAFSNILNYNRSTMLSSSIMIDISKVLAKLSQKCQNHLAIGESSYNIITSNIVLATSMNSKVSLLSPLSQPTLSPTFLSILLPSSPRSSSPTLLPTLSTSSPPTPSPSSVSTLSPSSLLTLPRTSPSLLPTSSSSRSTSLRTLSPSRSTSLLTSAPSSKSSSLLPSLCPSSLSSQSQSIIYPLSPSLKLSSSTSSTISSLSLKSNIIRNNMQLSNTLNSFGITLYVAQSDFDKFLKIPSASINIDGANLNDLDILGTTLIQYSKNHYYHNKDFKSHLLNSTSLHIQCTRYSNDYDTINNRRLNTASLGLSSSSSSSSTASKSNNIQNSRRKLISSSSSDHSLGLKILLQNKAPVTYIDIKAEVIEFKCVTPKAQPYEVVIDCKLSGLKYTATCPSSDRGTYNITCPRIFSIPQCQFYDGSTYIEDRSCEVIDYSSNSTTCHCISASLGTTTSTSSRRYLSSLLSADTEYVSTAVLVVFPTQSKFIVLPKIQLPSRSNAILISISIYFFILLFVYALLSWKQISNKKIFININNKIKYSSSKHHHHHKRTIKSFYESIIPYIFRRSHKLWIEQIKKNLFLNHSWLKIYSEIKNQNNLKSMNKTDVLLQYWINSMLKLLTIIFFNSLVASIIYPYDDTCMNMLIEKECYQHRSSYLSIYQSCEWIIISESCNYKGPDFTQIRYILLFSAIIVVFSTIYNQIFDWVLEKSYIAIYKIYTVYIKKYRNVHDINRNNEEIVIRHNNNSKDINSKDEFLAYETKKLLLLRAARLEKTSFLFLSSTIHEESHFLYQQHKKLHNKQKKVQKANQELFHNFNMIVDIKSKEMIYDKKLKNINKKSIYNLIYNTRYETRKLSSLMNRTHSNDDKEKLLAQYFIFENIPNFMKGFTNYIYRSDYYNHIYPTSNNGNTSSDSGSNNDQQPIDSLALLSLLYVLLHFFGSTFMVIYTNEFNLTTNSAILWMITLLFSLIQYYCFIEVMIIIIKYVIITQYLVGGLFFEITNMLAMRTKLILMRSSGLMRNAHSLVQHFNPACRVARLYPTLPLSRLLISINDVDIRNLSTFESLSSSAFSSSSWNMKRIIATICFLPFAYMPYKIGEIFMLILILALWNGITLSFYYLWVCYHIIFIIILSLLLLLIVIILIYKYIHQYIKYRSEEYQIDDEIKKVFFDSKQLTFKPLTKKFKIALKGNNFKKVYIDKNDDDYISSLPNDINDNIKNNSSGNRNMAHIKMIYGGMNNSSIIIIDDSKIDDINHVDESSSGIDSSSLYNETADRKKQRNRKRKNNNKHLHHHRHHRNMLEEDSISMTNTDINLDVDDSLFSSQSLLMNDNDGDDHIHHGLPSSPLFTITDELSGNQQNDIINNYQHHHQYKQQLLSSSSNNSDNSMIYDGKDINISIINTTNNTDNTNSNLNCSSSITTKHVVNDKKSNDDSKNNDDYDSNNVVPINIAKITETRRTKKNTIDNVRSYPALHHSLPHQLHQPLSSLHSPLPSPEHSPQNFGRIGKYSRRKNHNKDHQHHVNILGPGERKSIDMLQQQSYFDDNIRDHRENYTDLLVLPTNIELPMVDILNPNATLLKNKIYNNYDYKHNDKNDYNNIDYSQLSNTNSIESLSIISPTSYDIIEHHHHSSSTYDNHHSTSSQDHINLSNSSIRNNSQSDFYRTSNSNNNKSYDISNHNDDSMITYNNNHALVTPMNKQQLHEIGKSSLHSKNRHRYRSRLKKEFYMDG